MAVSQIDPNGLNVGQLGSRNMVINGKFEIDQRHGFASHTISTGADFFADRWGFYTDSGAFAQYGATSQVVSDGPSGFEKSLKWTTTSSGTIPATGEVIFRHVVEGYNTNQIDYGTSNAKEVTLSFYVKSSIAGNYGLTGQYTDSGGTNRYNLRSYTVSSANTWEFKTISIPANTANVLQQKTNGAGLRLNWDLGEGSQYSGNVTGNWQSTYVNGLTGGVKIADNNGATWQITGVQLEVSPTGEATPFEHENYGTTLAKCQRYYYQIGGAVQGGSGYDYLAHGFADNTGRAIHLINFPQEMRAAPTLVTSQTVSQFYWRAPIGNPTSPNATALPTASGMSKVWARVDCNGSGFSAGTGCFFEQKGSVDTFLAFNAEL